MADEYGLNLFESIYLALLEANDVEDGEAIIRNCVRGKAITWEMFQKTLLVLRHEATADDLAVLPFSADAFFHLITKLAIPHC